MSYSHNIGSEGFLSAAGGWNPERGIVYIATSTSRLGWVKLGATEKMTLEARLKKFRSKYRLLDATPVFAMYVSSPALLEDLAQRHFRNFRVSGRTRGESNEWYTVDAEALALYLVETATNEIFGAQVSSIRLFGQYYPDVLTLLDSIRRKDRAAYPSVQLD